MSDIKVKFKEIGLVLSVGSYRVLEQEWNEETQSYSNLEIKYFAEFETYEGYWSNQFTQDFDRLCGDRLGKQWNGEPRLPKRGEESLLPNPPSWLLGLSIGESHNNEWIVSDHTISVKDIAKWAKKAFTHYMNTCTVTCPNCKRIEWVEATETFYCGWCEHESSWSAMNIKIVA